MEKIELLTAFRELAERATSGIALPVRPQKSDKQPPVPRPPVHYLMRVPDSSAADKKVPYILHMLIGSKDIHPQGQAAPESRATICSTVCVYDEDEQGGAMLALSLLEAMRIEILRNAHPLGGRYTLDREGGVEYVLYPDTSAPYYIGELIAIWDVPAVAPQVGHM